MSPLFPKMLKKDTCFLICCVIASDTLLSAGRLRRTAKVIRPRFINQSNLGSGGCLFKILSRDLFVWPTLRGRFSIAHLKMCLVVGQRHLKSEITFSIIARPRKLCRKHGDFVCSCRREKCASSLRFSEEENNNKLTSTFC